MNISLPLLLSHQYVACIPEIAGLIVTALILLQLAGQKDTHREKNQDREYETIIRQLTEEKVRWEHRLEVLRERLREIQAAQAPFDLQSRGVTFAEKKVLRILCLYRASNRDIAKKLGIAESTVKIHISHIMDKLGVDDRYAIIDLCRYNFVEEKV
jgi:ATP/maltotriose-dependent transcriptional regulator MalT